MNVQISIISLMNFQKFLIFKKKNYSDLIFQKFFKNNLRISIYRYKNIL